MCDAKNSNMSNLFLELTCTRYKLDYTRVHTNKIRSTTYDNAIFEKRGSYLNYHYNPERNSFHKKSLPARDMWVTISFYLVTWKYFRSVAMEAF